MDLLEIVMLIIGVAVIIISSIIVNRKPKEGDNNDDSDVQEKLALIREQYKESLTATSDEVITNAEDYLSRLSNEKIMAVSEFSDQILDKINHNHEEVVFLYNMLNNKERELKEFAKELDNSKDVAKESKSSKRVNVQAQVMDNDGISSVDKDINQNKSLSINNKEILKLYSEGLSIMDISRQLGIGQGEVKLIIDLYKDK